MVDKLESGDMVKYQFEIDDDLWLRWKNTVPRSKSLDSRIRELIEADADGRVLDAEPEPEPELVVEDTTAPREPAPVSESVREQLRDELAGSGDLLDRRVDAILTMYGVLREVGEAEKGELLEAVDVDATGYASADSVWSNMVKGCDTLRSLPGVELPPTGRTTWRYDA